MQGSISPTFGGSSPSWRPVDCRPVKALLLENIHPDATKILTAAGFEVENIPGALPEDDLIDALDGVTVVGIRSRTQVSERVIANAPESLKAIGCFCIGTNQVALPAAAQRGIPVFNAPYSNTRSVVELAMAEIVCMARRLTEKNEATHRGEWIKSAAGSHEVRGRTLGIVGYGNIGSQLSVLAELFGMHVAFYDVVDKLALGNARRCNSLDELLETCETISLHVDGRPENTNFFGDAEFAKMRPRSLFLNLCRGHVVDVPALAKHLRSGHIAGAAVDVFPSEPKSSSERFVSELQGIPNVILTPHVGGSTAEAQHNIGHFVAGKLANYVETGSTQMAVNFPQVHIEASDDHVRILDLHENRPGVLADLNQVFARHGANIASQTLSTQGQVGYVITDITHASDGLLDELRALPGTIRVEVVGRTD